MVRVTEEWYIFGMPFWEKEGGDFTKITYGLRYLQKNFRGRNERISTSVWTGYESGYQIAYSNPWVYGRGTWGLNTEIFRVMQEVKNEKYREIGAEIRATGGRIGCQRRFGLDTRFMVTLGVTSYKSDYPGLMCTDELHDDWVSLSISYINDERDLYEYPTRGWLHRVNLSGSALMEDFLPEGKRGSANASLEIRHYRQIWKDFIVCERGMVAMSGGQIPLYRRYFLGSGTKVRGWRGDTEEGEGIFLGSLELRHPLFGVHYFTWEKAPYAKRYFRNLKYGLSAGLFADLGQVWLEPGEASIDKFQVGYGVGLHVHLPYLDILRLEAGWSPESIFSDAKLSVHSRVAF
jgi:outer membrane protein assembly factor BamA